MGVRLGATLLSSACTHYGFLFHLNAKLFPQVLLAQVGDNDRTRPLLFDHPASLDTMCPQGCPKNPSQMRSALGPVWARKRKPTPFSSHCPPIESALPDTPSPPSPTLRPTVQPP